MVLEVKIQTPVQFQGLFLTNPTTVLAITRIKDKFEADQTAQDVFIVSVFWNISREHPEQFDRLQTYL